MELLRLSRLKTVSVADLTRAIDGIHEAADLYLALAAGESTNANETSKTLFQESIETRKKAFFLEGMLKRKLAEPQTLKCAYHGQEWRGDCLSCAIARTENARNGVEV